MKKLISLVALAGVLALMSFTFKAERQKTFCESVEDVCLDVAWSTITDHDYSSDEASVWYYSCTALNGC